MYDRYGVDGEQSHREVYLLVVDRHSHVSHIHGTVHAFFCHARSNDDQPHVRVEKFSFAKVHVTEDETVATVAKRYDGFLREYDRFPAVLGSGEFGEEDAKESAVYECSDDRLNDQEDNSFRAFVCYCTPTVPYRHLVEWERKGS